MWTPCFKCGFHTTIKDRFKACPVCNNNFTELNGKESKTFLNFNSEQRIKWIENKLGYSISNEFNIKRENYKNQKINEIQTQNTIQQSVEFNSKMAYGKAILEEHSHQPECPTCHSKNVQRISGLERGASIVGLGIFSKKINKSFKCKNCGHTW